MGWRDRLQGLAAARREGGQIIVLFAVFLIVLMVLAGSAYDYASITVDDAQLQNAVDAAVLAGSNSLNANAALVGSTPVAMASATAAAYLRANGVSTATPGTTINMTFPTSTPAPGSTPVGALYENISITATRSHNTAFWPLVGLNSVTMSHSGEAHAARNMVDVMLSLDTTGSEVISGSLGSIQQAVGNFVTTMNPSSTDTRGPRIGISRFAGIQCQYDALLVYGQNCQNDWAVLSPLTNDRATLLAIANGGTACPAGDAAKGGCPIQHVYYNASNRATTTNATTASNNHYDPGFTGTKLPNAFFAIGMTGSGTSYAMNEATYAFSTTNNGRNNSTTNSPLNARKVLVIMTDGQNEMYPSSLLASPETVSSYNTMMQSMADALQKGPDGVTGTNDDVEVYVVGYFCTDTTGSSAGYCKSNLAKTSAPHACPGAVYPTGTSDIDDRLNQLASSSPGSCDHYFPLGKTESVQSLPSLFQSLAGRISRAQLTR